MNEEKSISVVERLKQLAMEQKREPIVIKSADAFVIQCPRCGAGRAQSDGITRCGYCGHRFTSVAVNDGINIKKDDNSK